MSLKPSAGPFNNTALRLRMVALFVMFATGLISVLGIGGRGMSTVLSSSAVLARLGELA